MLENVVEFSLCRPYVRICGLVFIVRGWAELTGILHFRVMRHSPWMVDIDVFSPLILSRQADQLVDKPHSESPWPPCLGSRCAPSCWSYAGAASAFATSRRAKPSWLGLAPRCVRWDRRTRLGDGAVPLCRPYVKSSTWHHNFEFFGYFS